MRPPHLLFEGDGPKKIFAAHAPTCPPNLQTKFPPMTTSQLPLPSVALQNYTLRSRTHTRQLKYRLHTALWPLNWQQIFQLVHFFTNIHFFVQTFTFLQTFTSRLVKLINIMKQFPIVTAYIYCFYICV